jgi:hypothetical protein
MIMRNAEGQFELGFDLEPFFLLSSFVDIYRCMAKKNHLQNDGFCNKNVFQVSIPSTFYAWLLRQYFCAKKLQRQNVSREKLCKALLYEKFAGKIVDEFDYRMEGKIVVVAKMAGYMKYTSELKCILYITISSSFIKLINLTHLLSN